jgi:hypothetical protein
MAIQSKVNLVKQCNTYSLLVRVSRPYSDVDACFVEWALGGLPSIKTGILRAVTTQDELLTAQRRSID